MRPAALRLRPTLAVAALLAAAGCASAAPETPSDQVAVVPTRTRIETPTGTYELRNTVEDRAEAIVIKANPDVAWAKMTAVYAEMGLPVNTLVESSRQVGVRGHRVRGRLNNIRLSQLVHCGSDVTGEDKANQYELILDVTSALGPAPEGQTQIVTMVTANGRAMSTSSDPVRCTSTGQLEKRLANALLAKTSTSP